IATSARSREPPHEARRADPPLQERIQNKLACNGRREEIGVKAPACIHAGARSGTRLGCGSVSTLLFLQCLSHYYEGFSEFVPELGKLHCQQCPLGINDNVGVRPRGNALQSHRFPQPPLHTIALDGSAERLADREPDASPHALFSGATRTRHIKHRQMSGKVTAALLIYPLKVRVPQ